MQTQFFPSRTMSIYMGRMFLVRSFAVLAALVLVLQALDLLGESGKILAQPGNGNAELWTYVSLRVPQIIQRFLPFSVLLGTLITLATLNQNSEVIAMKSSGLSAHQVLAPLILTSIIVAAITFVFNDRIVTRATSTLDRWQAVDYAPLPPDRALQANIWVRDGNNLIHAGQVRGRGAATRLSDVTVYDRENDALREIVKAPTAVYTGTAWRLDNATRFDVPTGVNRPAGTVTIGKDIRPDQFTLSSVDPDGLSFVALNSAIEDLDVAGRPTKSLKANLWHKIAGPMSSILMPLLGAVAAFGLARSGRLFLRAVIGMALGFAYFVADNFGLAMGNLGAYPPFLAAWGPFLLFLLIGETVLIRTEE
ncbi:LPS export ABC transporter permease LptG [Sphingomonas colocasiae]|uniref:LPS export ABC transporter permease LptG n=1 Tax=Sphingomonas colocasiae TaxID=1848973 RepID=A0ABS7PX55_9SPHN|nr:LPS export ABC transporter permease LptG [Sphingomonas colocasiae]MBY8825940.1 LPS export ABC transporter permease LptG [Sphingomonas colocasiae]